MRIPPDEGWSVTDDGQNKGPAAALIRVSATAGPTIVGSGQRVLLGRITPRVETRHHGAPVVIGCRGVRGGNPARRVVTRLARGPRMTLVPIRGGLLIRLPICRVGIDVR